MANATYLAGNLPENFSVDYAFECAGGEGSVSAINEIVEVIKPQGVLTLMGVTENPVGIATRTVLEKGLTLVGSSRSGRLDFEKAASLWEKDSFCARISRIIFEDSPVRDVDGIHRVFGNDLSSTFKTAFSWEI